MHQPPVAYVAGEFRPADQATVPITDAGLLQGIGVYETLRTYGGRPFRLEAHLRRLHAGIDFLGIRLGESDERIAAVVARLVESNQVPDARVRITVTAGPMDRAEADPPAPATRIVTAVPLVPYATELYERGAAVVIATLRARRLDPVRVHKTTSRNRQFLALRAARRMGATEAVFLNTLDRVAEGTVSNVFIVQRGQLLTPPPEEGLMPGITRAAVLEVSHAAGMVVEERPITGEEFLKADEALITNSIMEVMPVVSVDGRPIGDGRPGPITRRLMDAYKDLVRCETQAGPAPHRRQKKRHGGQ